MTHLPSLICPECHDSIASADFLGRAPTATRFEDCLRRCESCRVGASNAADPGSVTFIHDDPLRNIPVESRHGAIEALAQAFNVRNRESKFRRFGFSTSEDAVTWVVFTYLLRSGQLLGALRHAGIIAEKNIDADPTLLLWGVPIDNGSGGADLRRHLRDLCTSLQEDPNSFSEPDVIIDLGEDGLVFIEVKHLSGNDLKPADYPGWSRYASAARMGWRIDDVKASGCYELARNWCLLMNLAGERPASLVNLGPARLFGGAEGARLDRFVTAMGGNDRSHFKKVTWVDLLGTSMRGAPDWFAQYCRGRGLTA